MKRFSLLVIVAILPLLGISSGCRSVDGISGALKNEIGWVRLGITTKELTALRPGIERPSEDPIWSPQPDQEGIWREVFAEPGHYFQEAHYLIGKGQLVGVALARRGPMDMQFRKRTRELAQDCLETFGKAPQRSVVKRPVYTKAGIRTGYFAVLRWRKDASLIQFDSPAFVPGEEIITPQYSLAFFDLDQMPPLPDAKDLKHIVDRTDENWEKAFRSIGL